jgi:hypothetical protein
MRFMKNNNFTFLIVLGLTGLTGCASHHTSSQTARDVASIRMARPIPRFQDLTAEQLKITKQVINSFADLFTAMDESYEAGKNGALNLGLNESPLFEKIKPLVKECEDVTQNEPEIEEFARPGNRTWKAGFEGKKCPFNLKTELTVVTNAELDPKILGGLAPHGSFTAVGTAGLTVDSKELKDIIGISSVTMQGSANSSHTGTEAQGKTDIRGEVVTTQYGKVGIRGDSSGTLTRTKRPEWGEDWKVPSQGTVTGTITMDFMDKGFAAQFKVVANLRDDGEAGKITEDAYAKQFKYYINEKEVKRADFVALLKPEHGSHIMNEWPHGEVRSAMKHALNPWIYLKD